MSDLARYLERGQKMTVGELREELKGFDDSDIVLVGYTASDYWRSPVAHHITGVSNEPVAYTSYHGCATREGGMDEGEETRNVVIISC